MQRIRGRCRVPGCLLTLLCACVLATPGHAASGPASAFVAASPSTPPAPTVIVLGFLGGFVARDEPHHPEVQLIQNLRREYSSDVYFELFENRKVGSAYNTILKLLGTGSTQEAQDQGKPPVQIVLFGHSWGASAVVALSRKLQRAGIPVALTVQIDSVAKPFHNDWLIPANVLQAVNFYQTRGLIHGRSKIVAADPAHTAILGNFLREYKGEPSQCSGLSWRARFLSKGHNQIECDPRIWSEVKTLLRPHLPNPVVSDTGPRKQELPTPRNIPAEASAGQTSESALTIHHIDY